MKEIKPIVICSQLCSLPVSLKESVLLRNWGEELRNNKVEFHKTEKGHPGILENISIGVIIISIIHGRKYQSPRKNNQTSESEQSLVFFPSLTWTVCDRLDGLLGVLLFAHLILPALALTLPCLDQQCAFPVLHKQDRWPYSCIHLFQPHSY